MEIWIVATPVGAEQVSVYQKDVKNMYLRFRDGMFHLTMPRGGEGRARRFLTERAQWMAGLRTRTQRIERPYTEDYIMLYGEKLPVRMLSNAPKGLTRGEDGFVYHGDKEGYAPAVLAFYRAEGEMYYRRLLAEYGEKYPDFADCSIRIRKMVSMWGSYHVKTQTVTLNVKLVAAPARSIAMVLFHELCHSVEPNHRERFYRLLRREFPDDKKCKTQLNAICLREE